MFRIFKKLKAKIIELCLNETTIRVDSLFNNAKICKITDQNGNLKFIENSKCENISVRTPHGYSPIKQVLKTIKYQIYEVLLEDGKKIRCADMHILIDENDNEIFTKNLISNKTFLKTIDGYSKVVSVIITDDYEHMYDLELNDYNHIYYTNGILSHNTTTIAMYLLWFAIFNFDKTLLIASKDNTHAIDIQDRIKYAYEELPSWLKPGVVWYNRHSMKFDNGSQIISTPTTEKTGRGYSISYLYLDEFAFINPRIQEALWASIAPTLATGGSCIISSTPNGDSDLFATLWRGSLSRVNNFANIEIDWRRHPDRDEVWATDMRGKLGELKFRQECDNEFLSSDALLINSIKANNIKTQQPIMIDDGISYWTEKVGGYGKIYLVGVDVSEGQDGDFSAIEVLEFPSLIQVAEYRTNDLNIPKFYDKIKRLLNKLTLQDANGRRAEVLWSFENNSIGAAIGALYYSDEKQPEYAELISSTDKKLGMVTTGKNKILSCLQLKALVEKIKNNLTVNSPLLLFELKNYINHSGSYAAKKGATDDLISAMLIVMQLLKRMAEFDDRAYSHVYRYDESHYDPTSEVIDDEELPLPFI